VPACSEFVGKAHLIHGPYLREMGRTECRSARVDDMGVREGSTCTSDTNETPWYAMSNEAVHVTCACVSYRVQRKIPIRGPRT
jgi:hypothetical protein